jgi:hypothetical protein
LNCLNHLITYITKYLLCESTFHLIEESLELKTDQIWNSILHRSSQIHAQTLFIHSSGFKSVIISSKKLQNSTAQLNDKEETISSQPGNHSNAIILFSLYERINWTHFVLISTFLERVEITNMNRYFTKIQQHVTNLFILVEDQSSLKLYYGQ